MSDGQGEDVGAGAGAGAGAEDVLDSESGAVKAGMLRAGFAEGEWKHGFVAAPTKKKKEKGRGVQFHYVEAGDASKPLLLFVHGFPETWYSWRHQLKAFSADFRCVAFDMRGYNDSSKPDPTVAENYVIETLLEDVRTVILGLGCEKAHVWSHDWGSMVAWRFVLKYPEMVEKFVVESAPHPMQVQYYASVGQRLKHLPEIMFGAMAKRGFFEKAAVPDPRAFISDAFRKKKFAPVNLECIPDEDVEVFQASFSKAEAALCACAYYRHVEEVSKTKPGGYGDLAGVPVLALAGAQDQNIKPAALRGIEKHVADVRLHVLDNCSHWVHEDALEQVNELAREFLCGTKEADDDDGDAGAAKRATNKSRKDEKEDGAAGAGKKTAKKSGGKKAGKKEEDDGNDMSHASESSDDNNSPNESGSDSDTPHKKPSKKQEKVD